MDSEYAYWYCTRHDDACRVLLKQGDERHRATFWEGVRLLRESPKGNVCVSKDQVPECEWSYVGTRKFDATGECIYDNTHHFQFEMMAGGYKREYLDQCETIFEPIVKAARFNK